VAPAHVNREVRRSDGNFVILEIWDTAGHRRYSSISQLFYRNSHVAIVCIDSSDPTSVDAVPKWVKSVFEEADCCRLFAVITKADRIPRDEVEVTLARVKDAVKQIEFEKWFVASALTRTGVEEVFQASSEVATAADQLTALPAAEPERTGCC
jgi:small GTP-binding protein